VSDYVCILAVQTWSFKPTVEPRLPYIYIDVTTGSEIVPIKYTAELWAFKFGPTDICYHVVCSLLQVIKDLIYQYLAITDVLKCQSGTWINKRMSRALEHCYLWYSLFMACATLCCVTSCHGRV